MSNWSKYRAKKQSQFINSLLEFTKKGIYGSDLITNTHKERRMVEFKIHITLPENIYQNFIDKELSKEFIMEDIKL